VFVVEAEDCAADIDDHDDDVAAQVGAEAG
jgi:hypothetical protein